MSKRIESALLYLLVFAGFYSVGYEIRKLNRIVETADKQRAEIRQRQRTQCLMWVDLPNVYKPTESVVDLHKRVEIK